ncbi:type 1 glutamine amidotransferase [Stackebrandtia albiflava]|uniref:type 1 glutamine amidotransferase n=1 Tax=Stackebrandtia albiflava TaxID=406432 RepID=UPI001FCE422D|nr:type 1 glutamine amidotransferase [Stackebrandtia albiflava]
MTEAAPPTGRVLVVQNTPTGGPRRVADWLIDAGLTLDVVHGYEMPPPAELDHAAVIVLGGGFLPDEDTRAPWLAATRALVRQALDRQVPVLGICLGGQLLAHVAGGVVEGDVGAPEYGSTPIRLRAEASEDALFGGLPDVVPAIEHHVDAITKLPPDAVWLAETDRCPYQAFRVGPVAWGVQFHPEVNPDRILSFDAERLAAQGFDRSELHHVAMTNEPAAGLVWRKVIDRFADIVTESATRPGS